MREVRTAIEINAPASKVWRLLTDFEAYPEWNPFIRKIDGNLKTGAKLKVYVRYRKARRMSFHATVLKAEPDKELRWVGHLLFPRLLDGEHIFIIQPTAKNKVRFIHSEIFTGLFSFLGGLNKNTLRGLEEMNKALKNLAEKDSIT